VSLVPVEFCPHYAAVRKLNQGSALKLAPTASSVQPAQQAQETNPPPNGDDFDATDGATKPEAGHAATLTRGWSYWCPSNTQFSGEAPSWPRLVRCNCLLCRISFSDHRYSRRSPHHVATGNVLAGEPRSRR
jgi:hypothetical protein